MLFEIASSVVDIVERTIKNTCGNGLEYICTSKIHIDSLVKQNRKLQVPLILLVEDLMNVLNLKEFKRQCEISWKSQGEDESDRRYGQ